jgi:hypothetical protein
MKDDKGDATAAGPHLVAADAIDAEADAITEVDGAEAVTDNCGDSTSNE